MPTLGEVQRRDAERYRFLRSLYDATDGDTFATVDMIDFFKSLGLSEDAGLRVYRYLDQEGLASARTVGGIEITHAGVNEIEASLRRPNHATAHFSVPVIQHVEQHFHHAVGAVQTGASSVAHVTQNFGLAAAELLHLLAGIRGVLSPLSAMQRTEAEELIEGLEIEIRAEKPSKTRLRVATDALGRLFEAASASAAGTLLAQFAARALGL